MLPGSYRLEHARRGHGRFLRVELLHSLFILLLGRGGDGGRRGGWPVLAHLVCDRWNGDRGCGRSIGYLRIRMAALDLGRGHIERKNKYIIYRGKRLWVMIEFLIIE